MRQQSMALQNLDNRSIVLDTETTGMPVTDGHRIIEIGCVELIGRRLTGRHFHV
ncbi:exonuclease domain-containing protein, partial [Pseudomonas syringae]